MTNSLQIQTNMSALPTQQQQPPPTNNNNSTVAGSTGPMMLNSMSGQQQDPQSAANSTLSNSQNTHPSTSPQSYYSDQQSSQMGSVTGLDNQLSGSLVTSPISPHLQQNGYATNNATPGNVTGNGQLQGYTPQQQQLPNNGGQGTWTGPNTLTYTQTMQPPDPRTSSHNAYCKCSVFIPV